MLTSKDPVRTEGVTVGDFYHGHFLVPKEKMTDALREKRDTFQKQSQELQGKALDGYHYNPVTRDNIVEFTKAMTQTEALATPLLNESLKINGAAVLYHTFEMGQPLGVTPGSPVRNILTKVEDQTPQGYDPSGREVGPNQYRSDYCEILQFAFLVDPKGRIHVTVGTTWHLSRVTGSPIF